MLNSETSYGYWLTAQFSLRLRLRVVLNTIPAASMTAMIRARMVHRLSISHDRLQEVFELQARTAVCGQLHICDAVVEARVSKVEDRIATVAQLLLLISQLSL
jgi:hypothetical protein